MKTSPSKTCVLTHAELHARFNYDPTTGVLSYRTWRSGQNQNNKHAGHTNPEGYTSVSIHDKPYLAHRLIWFWVTGEWPQETLDHIDRDPRNNRFSNLRLATPLQQRGNTGLQHNNTSGIRGVSWHKTDKTWVVQLRNTGRRGYLGRRKNKEDAMALYEQAARQKWGEFYPGGDIKKTPASG